MWFPEPGPKLPECATEIEWAYNIRDTDAQLRVVLRNRYAFMGNDDLMNLRVEVRVETSPETMEWRTVYGTRTGLMKREEAERQAAAIYHGEWRKLGPNLADMGMRLPVAREVQPAPAP